MGVCCRLNPCEKQKLVDAIYRLKCDCECVKLKRCLPGKCRDRYIESCLKSLSFDGTGLDVAYCLINCTGCYFQELYTLTNLDCGTKTTCGCFPYESTQHVKVTYADLACMNSSCCNNELTVKNAARISCKKFLYSCFRTCLNAGDITSAIVLSESGGTYTAQIDLNTTKTTIAGTKLTLIIPVEVDMTTIVTTGTVDIPNRTVCFDVTSFPFSDSFTFELESGVTTGSVVLVGGIAYRCSGTVNDRAQYVTSNVVTI